MIAKHYLQVSDAMLIERLNTDWSLQLFCGIRLRAYERIKDEDLAGRWRMYLGKHLDIDKWQVHLVSAWKGDMQQTHVGFTDATCYESYITYPTDAKLISKCCNEVHLRIGRIRRKLKLRPTRSNHGKYKVMYLSYAKLKKKSKRKTKNCARRCLNTWTDC